MVALIGRDGPLRLVGQAMADALGAAGRLLLVTGEAGIGKSALADAAAELAALDGLQVLRGYAVDDAGAPPLWPWLRLAQDQSGLSAALDQRQAANSDLAARFQMFTAVTDQIRLLAEPRGLLIILEDLHWADRTSNLLLKHVVADLADMRLVILASAREGVDSPFSAVLPDLLRGGSSVSIRLGGLDSAAVRSWMRLLPARAAWESLADTVHRRTDGNPLLIRMVFEALPPEPGAAGVDRLDALLIDRPDLRALVTAKLADLSPAAREMIVTASVIAERIQPDLLAAVTESAIDQVVPLLTEALGAGVLRADPGGLAFGHALMRDAVYAGVLPARRAQIHRRTAVGLEATGDRALAGLIASHWRQVGDLAGLRKCLVWARIAADAAEAAKAFDEAAEFAELAVKCGQDTMVGAGEQAQLLLDLAVAQFAADRIAASLGTCVTAADWAERADRSDLLAQAALVIRGVGAVEVYRVVRQLCVRALDRLPADRSATRARLLAQIAVSAAEDGGGPDAVRLSGEALAIAEDSGDPQAILDAMAARHLSITVPETIEERRQLAGRAVELGMRADIPIAELWGHLWSFEVALQDADLRAADREIGELDMIARHRRSPLARWHCERLLATRTALQGDFAAARVHAAAALALAIRMGDVSAIGMFYAFRAQLAIVCGDPEEFSPERIRMLAEAPQIPLVRVALPIALAIRGDRAGAVAAFEEFRGVPGTFPIGTRWAPTLFQIGIAAVLLDDQEVAAQTYRLLAPTARWCDGDGSGAFFCHGSNALPLGDLALTAGQFDDALRHFADAVTVNARLGARPFTALSRLGWARALLARSNPAAEKPLTATDFTMIAKLLDQAAAEFRRLDMPGPLAKAVAVQEQLVGDRRSAHRLSVRESEVASLLANALSNKEIAQRLFLSERTVESHVRSILGKLGFSTRTEIATWVVRSGTTANH